MSASVKMIAGRSPARLESSSNKGSGLGLNAHACQSCCVLGSLPGQQDVSNACIPGFVFVLQIATFPAMFSQHATPANIARTVRQMPMTSPKLHGIPRLPSPSHAGSSWVGPPGPRTRSQVGHLDRNIDEQMSATRLELQPISAYPSDT